jgi:L-amino acid N-acyltransferase YncA
MKIRPYAAADAHALAAIHEEVYPERPRSAAQFNRRLGNIRTVDGNAWVIGDDTHVIGYAAAAPEPGLDGVMAMEGLIAPRRQRQGMGSRLLQHLLRELEAAGAKQASYCVEDLDSPAACFLRQHDFYEEHVEWIMELVDWDAFRVQQEAATPGKAKSNPWVS